MRAIAHPEPEQLTLPGILHALSDPVRLAIVGALRAGGERSCGRLAVPVAKSTLSHHLRVLRDAGLTRTRAEGVQRFVSLRTEDIEARFPGLLGCVLAHSEAPRGSARAVDGEAQITTVDATRDQDALVLAPAELRLTAAPPPPPML